MDLSTRKLHLINEFLRITDAGFITKLESFFRSNNRDRSKMSPMSEEDFFKMINQSKKERETGEVISHKELLSQIEEW